MGHRERNTSIGINTSDFSSSLCKAPHTQPYTNLESFRLSPHSVKWEKIDWPHVITIAHITKHQQNFMQIKGYPEIQIWVMAVI